MQFTKSVPLSASDQQEHIALKLRLICACYGTDRLTAKVTLVYLALPHAKHHETEYDTSMPHVSSILPPLISYHH